MRWIDIFRYFYFIVVFFFCLACCFAAPKSVVTESYSIGDTIITTDPITEQHVSYTFTSSQKDSCVYKNENTQKSHLLKKDDCITGKIYNYCLSSATESAIGIKKYYRYPIMSHTITYSDTSPNQGQLINITLKLANDGILDANNVRVYFFIPEEFIIDDSNYFSFIHDETDPFGNLLNNSLYWNGKVEKDDSVSLTFTLKATREIVKKNIYGYYLVYNGSDYEKYDIKAQPFSVSEDVLEVFTNYTSHVNVGEQGYFYINFSNELDDDIIDLQYRIIMPDFILLDELDSKFNKEKNWYRLDKTINDTKQYGFTFTPQKKGNDFFYVDYFVEYSDSSYQYGQKFPLISSSDKPIIELQLGSLQLIDFQKTNILSFKITNPKKVYLRNVTFNLQSAYYSYITDPFILKQQENTFINFTLPIENISQKVLYPFTLEVSYNDDNAYHKDIYSYNISLQKYTTPTIKKEIPIIHEEQDKIIENVTKINKLRAQIPQSILEKENFIDLLFYIFIPENVSNATLHITSDLFLEDVTKIFNSSGYKTISFKEEIKNSSEDDFYIDYVLEYSLDYDVITFFNRSFIHIDREKIKEETIEEDSTASSVPLWYFILPFILVIFLLTYFYFFTYLFYSYEKLSLLFNNKKQLLEEHKKEFLLLSEQIKNSFANNPNHPYFTHLETVAKHLENDEKKLLNIEKSLFKKKEDNMSFFNKLFHKKEEEFSLADTSLHIGKDSLPSYDPGLSQDNGELHGDFKVSSEFSTNRSQNFSQPQYQDTTEKHTQELLVKDMQILNAKLDTIKSQLDILNQKIDSLEKQKDQKRSYW